MHEEEVYFGSQFSMYQVMAQWASLGCITSWQEYMFLCLVFVL
jgi:hypothetical protein